jgi:pimeloyl-ACP methyl ester carboxylesterase
MGSGPPVILLHGTPSSSYLWREVASTLASRFTVYVFDWPGYGQSARGPGINLSWDEQARRLVELIDHWGLDRPAIVAHDIAPVLALRAHLLEGMAAGPLVLADAGLVPPFVTGFSRHVRDHIGVFRAIPTHIAEAMIRRHIETTVSRPMAEDVLDAYMAPWRGAEGVAAYWDAVAAYDEGLARPAVERLGAVDTPMLEAEAESEDAAVAFSGTVLSVDDIEDVFFDHILPNRPLEVAIPRSRGALAKLTNLVPGVVRTLLPLFEKLGEAKLEEYRERIGLRE